MFAHLHTPSTLILGLGESGLAMARWCAAQGCRIRVADTRDQPDRLSVLQQEIPAAEFVSGPFTEALLEGVELIGISPGLSPHVPQIAALLTLVQQKNIPVWGEIEFFAQALHHLREQQAYQPKIIAITGTNGKTTVTQLTGKLCARAGKSVAIAGNISPCALDTLSERLAQQTLPEAWVLELSSFQLATTHSLVADVATVLNLSQDHLDWHPDMQAYAQAKARIFSARTLCVLNRGDKTVMAMALPGARVITFGDDVPHTLGCFGLVNEQGMEWLAYAESDNKDEPPVKQIRRQGTRAIDTSIRAHRLMPVEALRIRGRHNAMNALVSLALAQAIDLPLGPLLHGLRDYQGEAHRVQTIAVVNEVEYIDDSKGTNVGATITALESIGLEKKILLIAGGVGKDQDFSALANVVSRVARAVLLIGQDGPKIRQALNHCINTIEECATLEQAVQRATTLAHSGDAVLLSPACASFDMFRDYKERAKVFSDAVHALAVVPMGALS
ncbi:MAG: UDP-N-acetylmuramoyl-L-alanine--D-glutamate ligase [Ottowia sp.]|nr:UDP-N-acetylmuramoyl-L-alanine--D-glutamate ligase [Ottowia sp.]